jgi:glycosyltransferase involved in cell wall biosynthesis
MRKGPETGEVTILGVHVKSAGYPNVTFRIRGLFDSPALIIREINFPFSTKTSRYVFLSHIWKPLKLVWASLRLIYSHVHIFFVYFLHGRARRLYIPYPSVIVLFFFSLLPGAWRPKLIVADCFISLYDTVVTDRELLSPSSWMAQSLKSMETRAYRTADVIVVDTELNSGYFIETFGIATSKILVLPLSIDESIFRPDTYLSHDDTCTVLFIGTFVPLQGVEIIAKAAVILSNQKNIRFRIIGSGQTAEAVERIFTNARPANVQWITEWRDSEQLAEEIRRADICLGIFGTGLKTQRVWPLKNYLYMAVGRPLITGNTRLAQRLLKQADSAPFMTIPNGNPDALAAAIVKLANDPDLRKEYAVNAGLFYNKHLRSSISLEQIVSRLAANSAKPL